jgi:hypothetical protein
VVCLARVAGYMSEMDLDHGTDLHLMRFTHAFLTSVCREGIGYTGKALGTQGRHFMTDMTYIFEIFKVPS